MEHNKILIVEDDKVQVELLSVALKEQFQVTVVNSIHEAEDQIKQRDYDMIIIDIGLPDGSGLNFLTRLRMDRHYSGCPIFILSSQSDLYTKISGLELGADDFLSKPIHPLELKARIKSKLYRLEQKDKSGKTLQVHTFSVDLEKRQVMIEEDKGGLKRIELTNREFDLLVLLLRHEGVIFSRQDLIDRIWSKDHFITDRVVDTHVAAIRKKVSPYSKCIKTEYGLGYKFVYNS